MAQNKATLNSPNLNNYIKEKKFDAIELTLLLKIIGLRLNSIDYDPKLQNGSNGVDVAIICKSSGLVSKLTFDGGVCSCPNRTIAENNAFWEIQGQAPNNSEKNFTDTSSNLLPILNNEVTHYIKVAFRGILDRLQESLTDKISGGVNGESKNAVAATINGVEEKSAIRTVYNSIPLIDDPIINSIIKKEELIDEISNANINSTFDKDDSPDKALPIIHKDYSTPLSSINVTPTEPKDFNGLNAGLPKIILQPAITFNTPVESTMKENQNPREVIEVFNSPNSDVFSTSSTESNFNQNLSKEKGDNVIKSIKDAQAKLNEALNQIQKVNNSTSTPSQNLKKLIKLPISASQSRRHSYGLPEDKPVNRKPLSSVNGTTSTGLGLKNATIQPKAIANIKSQTVETQKLTSKVTVKVQSRYSYTPRPAAEVNQKNTVDVKVKRSNFVGAAGPLKSALTKATSKSMTNLPTLAKK